MLISVMVSEGPTCLLRSEHFKKWLTELKTSLPQGLSPYITEERAFLHLYFAECLDVKREELIKHCISSDICKSLKVSECVMQTLSQYLSSDDYDVSKSINFLLNSLRHACGTLVLSFVQRTRMPNVKRVLLLQIIEQLLGGNYQNACSQLKMACFYYQVGKYNKAIDILTQQSDFRWISKRGTFGESSVSRTDRHTLASIDSPFDAFSAHISTSLVFVWAEIHATPDALKLEMFKPNELPENTYDEENSIHQKDASMNVGAFIYYLQYLCYKCIGKKNHAQVALCNLHWISRNELFLHRETTLNVLGNCYMKSGKLRQAASCFVESWKAEPKFTVAPLHLAILIGKALNRA